MLHHTPIMETVKPRPLPKLDVTLSLFSWFLRKPRASFSIPSCWKMADPRPGGGKIDSASHEGFFLREKGTREELKIAVNVAIERFRQDEDQKEFTFPSSLTSAERAYVHRYCQKFGLKTKSRGQGNQRSLSVFKKEREISMSTSELKISSTSLDKIDHLLKKFPVTNKEKQEVAHKKVFKGLGHDNNKTSAKDGKFLLGSSPSVPPKVKENDATAARVKFPIYGFREKLLKAIKTNQVMLVTGETGCGKTTQVPQYILEDATKRQQACKVICTQPRRISAISVSERVAYERGESVGQAVGFQIRLESRVSAKTSLLFCTNGVLLRMLMAGHKSLSNVSHIIIDEIHERDKVSDYLLICIRDQLKSYKNLRVVLMSAALNVGLFKEYFGGCQVIHIPAMCHDVETFFLEDVLDMTGYRNKTMKALARKSSKNDQTKEKVLEKDQKQETDQMEEKSRKLKAGSVKVLKKKAADENSSGDLDNIEGNFAKKDRYLCPINTVLYYYLHVILCIEEILHLLELRKFRCMCMCSVLSSLILLFTRLSYFIYAGFSDIVCICRLIHLYKDQ